MSYFLAALAASGIFVAAGWRSKQTRGVAAAPRWQGMPIDPLWGEEDVGQLNNADTNADVNASIRLVLKRLAPVMASQAVQADIASPSGLHVRMKSAMLTDILEELLAAAIHAAPASRLLMTATSHGDRVHISITDDMPSADPAVRQGRIRGVIERVAMRGGSLDVNVRPSEGTTMTLRLAAVTERDAPADKSAMAMSGPSARVVLGSGF
jgi:hypothetical protein